MQISETTLGLGREDTRSLGQFREAILYANLKKGVRLNFLRGEKKLSDLLKLVQE